MYNNEIVVPFPYTKVTTQLNQYSYQIKIFNHYIYNNITIKFYSINVNLKVIPSGSNIIKSFKTDQYWVFLLILHV